MGSRSLKSGWRSAVFGYSAGGELALALGIRHPDIYGAVLAGSPGGGYRPPAVLPSPLPRVYLFAGTREPFFLDNATVFREYYTHGNKDLDGRLMFINAEPDSPWAGVILANNPGPEAARIAEALKANLIVRTRADGDNVEPFAGDTTHREEAFASGAQLVSTDYPVPVKGVNYVVEIPGGTPSPNSPRPSPRPPSWSSSGTSPG